MQLPSFSPASFLRPRQQLEGYPLRHAEVTRIMMRGGRVPEAVGRQAVLTKSVTAKDFRGESVSLALRTPVVICGTADNNGYVVTTRMGIVPKTYFFEAQEGTKIAVAISSV